MSNGTNDDLRIGISILDEDLARVELLDKRLGSLTTTTTGLGTASKAGLGQMAEAMKEAKLSVRSVADAYNYLPRCPIGTFLGSTRRSKSLLCKNAVRSLV